MLRLTEIKLPLDHTDDALSTAICQRLGVAADELLSHSVYRRSVDARKKTAITLIYALDVEVRDEAAVLARGRVAGVVGRVVDGLSGIFASPRG